MIVSFKDKATQDIFNGKPTRHARKALPTTLFGLAGRKLDLLDSVASLEELKVPPGNRLEALAGDRKGQHSIRINQQYRICFFWGDSGPEQVEATDYH